VTAPARLSLAALSVALLVAAAGHGEPAADAGLADGAADAGGEIDRCAAIEARIEARRAWLAARRQEQFEKGGPPDPARAIPNMIGVWCEAHPDDEQCKLGPVTIEVRTEEVAWSPEKTPEDYDAHVILMRRELAACRAKPLR
jgi:hypothetical protein